MHFIGTVEFNASANAIWQLLTNPDGISRCLPGIKAWHRVYPGYTFDLLFQWPPNQSHEINWPVRLEWTEQRTLNYLALKATTQMGSQQIVGVGDFSLNPITPEKTEVSFTVDVTTPNPMLDRIVHTAVPKLANAFFTCLRSHLESGIS